MGKKAVALFVVCMVVVAAMEMSKVKAGDDVFKSCYNGCEKECRDQGKGYTQCEMKCDEDCSNKQAKEMLGIKD